MFELPLLFHFYVTYQRDSNRSSSSHYMYLLICFVTYSEVWPATLFSERDKKQPVKQSNLAGSTLVRLTLRALDDVFDLLSQLRLRDAVSGHSDFHLQDLFRLLDGLAQFICNGRIITV